MRRLIIGDIHGCYDKLMKVLEKVNFSNTDFLYSVGDFCDRGNENLKVLEFLMSLNKFNSVKGNHDIWLYNYLYCKLNDHRFSYEDLSIWERNGGNTTLNEIFNLNENKLQDIFDWIKKFPYIIYEKDFIIMHGGPLPNTSEDFIKNQSVLPLEESYDHTNWVEYNSTWYRNYTYSAITEKFIEINELDKDEVDYPLLDSPLDINKFIFVGHTPICGKIFKSLNTLPFISEKYHLINLDTGSYKDEGKLTLMNIDTKEYWQA